MHTVTGSLVIEQWAGYPKVAGSIPVYLNLFINFQISWAFGLTMIVNFINQLLDTVQYMIYVIIQIDDLGTKALYSPWVIGLPFALYMCFCYNYNLMSILINSKALVAQFLRMQNSDCFLRDKYLFMEHQ